MRFGYPVQAQYRNKYRIVRSGRDTNRQKTCIFVHQHIHMRVGTRHACPDREGGEPCSDRPNPSKGQGQTVGDRLQVGQLAVAAVISRCILHLICASKRIESAMPWNWLRTHPVCVGAGKAASDIPSHPSGCKATHTARRDGMRCDLRESGVIV